MDTQELIKKVRKVEIKTRGLSNQIFSGDYHSAFKGRGMTFSEVREYQFGDDIRTIDWNVTARSGQTHIKVFEEERELTVMLLIDVSASGEFGTKSMFKKELMVELAAIIAFAAIQNNDKIGVIFFSDRVEQYIPPKKGKSHILRIIRELIDFHPVGRSTDIGEALKFLSNVTKKKTISFLISDFISADFSQPLKVVSKRHDVVAIRLFDDLEQEIPDLGIMQLLDKETGKQIWVDTSSREFKNNYMNLYSDRLSNLNSLLQKNKIDKIDLNTKSSYIAPLRQFFKMREKRK